MYLKVHVYLWDLCCFNLMPCVISQWSPNLVSVVFVTTESDSNQCFFTLDDTFFPAAHGRKMFLDYVWVRLLPIGPKDHMQKRSYLMHSPYCPWGERKTLRVWVRLLLMGPRDCIPERTISCQLWTGRSPDQSMWYICDKLLYVIFYDFGIILLVLINYSI